MQCTITADHRENLGANAWLESACEPYAAINWQILNNETYGDYSLIINDEVVAVFERKTWRDLAASLKDSRARDQRSSLIALRYKINCDIYYIIEGTLRGKRTANVENHKLRAWLASSCVKHGITSIYARTPQETAHVLVDWARQYLQTPRKTAAQLVENIMRYEFFTNEQQQHFAEILQLCVHEKNTEYVHGGSHALGILRSKPQYSVNDTRIAMWQALPGVGPASALALSERWPPGARFRGEITARELAQTAIGARRTLGYATAQKILHASAPEKMLVAVRGISKRKANELLRIFTPAQLAACALEDFTNIISEKLALQLLEILK